MSLTRSELIALMENRELTEKTAEKERVEVGDPTSVHIVEELVYPYDLTHDMLEQYGKKGPLFNFHLNLLQLYIKLLRSCRFWRISPPSWLIERVGYAAKMKVSKQRSVEV